MRRPRPPRVPAQRRHRAHEASDQELQAPGRGGPMGHEPKTLRAEGILVEGEALEKAEAECQADAGRRATNGCGQLLNVLGPTPRTWSGLRSPSESAIQAVPRAPSSRSLDMPARSTAAGWAGAARRSDSI